MKGEKLASHSRSGGPPCLNNFRHFVFFKIIDLSCMKNRKPSLFDDLSSSDDSDSLTYGNCMKNPKPSLTLFDDPSSSDDSYSLLTSDIKPFSITKVGIFNLPAFVSV